MTTRIIPRAEWGFDGWRDGVAPSIVPISARTEFFVHYEGPATGGASSAGDILAMHHYHRDAQGWRGIGYSFVVTQDGRAWEGRGWDYSGSHCPNHNWSGWSVQVHLGGDETPTDAALNTVRDLYDEACARAGFELAKRGHRDGFSTSCPGDRLYAWVKAGMPRPATVAPPPAPAPTPHASPAWPYPPDHFFGPDWMGPCGGRRHSGTTDPVAYGYVQMIRQRMRERGWSQVSDRGPFWGTRTTGLMEEVVQFQALTMHEPPGDGLVGPRTWAALWSVPVS